MKGEAVYNENKTKVQFDNSCFPASLDHNFYNIFRLSNYFFDWDKFYRLFRVKPGDELCWFKKNYTALFKGEIFLKAMKTH